MLGAAAAWDKLADEMYDTAGYYSSAVSNVAGQGWRGPASTSMATAVQRYTGWMTDTAELCQQAAARARSAATAYESAVAMTVPPTVIAANRAQLSSLVATTALGQNAAAIAAVEGDYAEMWAQDVTAMHEYAGASAAASRLAPFAPPPMITDGAGPASGRMSVAGASPRTMLPPLLTAVSDALDELASPTSRLVRPLVPGIGALGSLGSAGRRATATPAAVSATIGRGASTGALSVPPTWARAALASEVAATSLQRDGINALRLIG
jgi:PPE-repeat protein